MAESFTSRDLPEGSTYRPIGEVATLLRLQPHVLRFWETKFKQISPLKRSGGRRYYRREDVRLLFTIRDLLYVEGYTLRGAQKALRERGRGGERGGMEEEGDGSRRPSQAANLSGSTTTTTTSTADHGISSSPPSASSNPLQQTEMSASTRASLEGIAERLERTLAQLGSDGESESHGEGTDSTDSADSADSADDDSADSADDDSADKNDPSGEE